MVVTEKPKSIPVMLQTVSVCACVCVLLHWREQKIC